MTKPDLSREAFEQFKRLTPDEQRQAARGKQDENEDGDDE